MFKPGVSGNPGGRQQHEKEFLAALKRAIASDDGKRLRAAAEKLLDLAASGKDWAIEQLANRLDGKPTQAVDMLVTRQVEELSIEELTRIARSKETALPAEQVH